MNRLMSFVFAFSILLNAFSFASDDGDEVQIENTAEAQAQTQNDLERIKEGISFIGLGAQELATTSAHFIWQRVPNSNELIYDVGLGSVIEIGLSGLGLNLGKDNPAAKAIIRDLSKVVSVVPKVYSNVEVGSTGIKFDSANVISQVAKPLSKAAGIVFLQRTCGLSGEEASEKANYLGDSVARAIVLAGIDRQKSNSTEPFHEYVVDNFDAGWGVGAVLQVIPKTWIVTLISHYIRGYKVGTRIDDLVYLVGSKCFGDGLKATASMGVFARAQYLQGQNHNRVVAYTSSFLLAYAATAMGQLVNTYLLATSGRITMDLVDWSTNRVKEPAYRAYVWLFPGSEASAKKEEL